MTTIEEERVSPAHVAAPRYLSWTPAVAGALIATAFATVLIAFGTAIGLGVASSAPTWRDASVALWLLSGIYLILVSLFSFGIGGYVAGAASGRTCPPSLPMTLSTGMAYMASPLGPSQLS
jgi:hypothetical protein